MRSALLDLGRSGRADRRGIQAVALLQGVCQPGVLFSAMRVAYVGECACLCSLRFWVVL